jgi:malic enzyme
MNIQTQTGVIETVKDKSVDAIKGTGKIIEATVDTAAHVVEATVKDTKVVGVGAEKAAAAIAGGAIKAVGEAASTTVSTVRDVVTKPFHSDKAASKEPAMATSH